MIWLWRTISGVDWADAQPALRMYFRSYWKLLLGLLALLCLITFAGTICSLAHIPRLPNPFLSTDWELIESEEFVLVTPLFAFFVTSCFFSLPYLPKTPLDVSRPFLLPRHIYLVGFAALAGIACGICYSIANHYAKAELGIMSYAELHPLVAGITAILIPTAVLVGIEHTAPRLKAQTGFALLAWCLVTTLVDVLAWRVLVFNYFSDSTHFLEGWQMIALAWLPQVVILLLLIRPRSRALGFHLSIGGFLLATVFSDILNRLPSTDFSALVVKSGWFGLGRFDSVYTWVVDLIARL